MKPLESLKFQGGELGWEWFSGFISREYMRVEILGGRNCNTIRALAFHIHTTTYLLKIMPLIRERGETKSSDITDNVIHCNQLLTCEYQD